MSKKKEYRSYFINSSLSQVFHENTKQFSKSYKVGVDQKYDETVENIHFKSYPRFKKTGLKDRFSKGKDLQKTLTESRSTTEFGARQIKLDEISRILFFSAGITFKKEEDGWDSLTPANSSLVAIKLENVTQEIGLKSP